MFFPVESQQHTLTDIHGMLVELRRLVSAHGEFLATFGKQTRSEETSDSLDECSPPQCWSPPPSVTQEPKGFKSYSLPRLKPPRFDGEMALDWICKVQEYYNHHYTPLDDRLYLTKYLFDPPTTDWFHNYQKTNTDGSWEDFLVAVYCNFSPDLTERADERQLVTLDSDEMKKIEAESTKTECESTEAKKEEKVEQTPTQVVEEAAPAMEEAPPAEPTECSAKSEADPVEENKVESQRDMKTEETAAEADKIELRNDVAEAKSVVAEELVEAEAKPQTEVVEMACGGEVTAKDVKSVEKDLFCLSQASDGRVTPPRMDVTRLGFSKDELIFAGSCILDYSFVLKEAGWCLATRQFGDEIGVRIFDPGPFDVSKLIRYGTFEDLTASLSIGVNNEGEERAGTTGVAVEAKIWCHFRSAYFFFPP